MTDKVQDWLYNKNKDIKLYDYLGITEEELIDLIIKHDWIIDYE